MSALIDSSVFLHLLLDGDRADEAEALLSSVEEGALRGSSFSYFSADGFIVKYFNLR